MKTCPINLLLAALLGLAACSRVFAADAAAPITPAKRPMEIPDLFRFHQLSDPQVSPDGRSVVYVVTDVVLDENRTQSDLWLVSIDGGTPRQLTTSPKNDTHPRWSPDGRWIAFESDRDGPPQIWLLPTDGGEAHRLTSVSTGATQPVWSPAGGAIAFVSAVFPEFSGNPFAESEKLNKEKLEAREKSPVKARLITSLLYRHWNAWVDGLRQHLFVVPIAAEGTATGEPRDVTPGENDAVPTAGWFVAGDEFAFSPDGAEIAFTAPPLPVRGQAWSTNHDIWAVELATGARRQISTNPAGDGCPRYSPDGRWLAYRSQRRPGFESDRWEVMLLDRTTGSARSLTSTFDRTIRNISWSADSRTLLCSIDDHGRYPLWAIATDESAPRRLVESTDFAVSVSASGDGESLVFLQSRLNQPPEVMRLSPGADGPQPLTHANKDWLAALDLPEPESVTVTGSGGTPVQMWVLRPPGFDPAKKYPVVLLVHGGPQDAWSNAWAWCYLWVMPMWAAQGYVIALPNPRGSTGFGQQFTDEVSRDLGGRAFEDLMACTAHLERLPYIDGTRMAAVGASYGGYMMNWFQGHTDKFRALVTHAGLFNFTSMYGATDEQWWPEHDIGIPWETPDFEKHSPHRFAANFKTPNLIIAGELDFRCPVTESLQLFTALQRRGVPSQLLLFPDEGHWILKPQNSELWHRTIFEWLAKYLKP